MRLGPDEEVLLELRASGTRLALPVLALLLVLGGTGYGLAATQGPARPAVAGAALLLLVALAGVPWLRWRSARCVLTDQRLAVRTGVLSRSGRDVPLTRVDEVLFRRTLRQRLLGRGTLVVVAGDGAPLEVADLAGVEEVQREVCDAVDRARDRAREQDDDVRGRRGRHDLDTRPSGRWR